MELLLESLVIHAGVRCVAAAAMVVTLLSGIGCANHNDRAEGYVTALAAGDWQLAVDAASRAAADGPSRNTVIDALELGTVQRIAGDYRKSDESLGRAWREMKRSSDPGKPAFIDTLAAVAANERALDYIGSSSDRVMCATFRALDAMAMGDLETARVELKRAQFAQEDAEARFADRIAKARKKMEGKHADVAKIEESGDFKSNYAQTYGGLEETFRPYDGWTNPFTDWLTAILLYVDGVDRGDENRAIDLLRRVRGTIGANSAVESDLAMVESSTATSPQVWLLLESGFAPRREEVAFRIPAFIPEMPFIGIALPKLVQVPGAAGHATITGDSATVETSVVCDMGSVIAQEFQVELPLITGRAIASAVAKAAASLAANLAAENSGNSWALVASMLATNVYGYATTIADLRTWRTLPRYFAVARIPAPLDGRVRIAGPAGVHELDVPLNRDSMIVLRSFRVQGPASIHLIPLDEAPPVESPPNEVALRTANLTKGIGP
ncbi:MAG: hypothetical protein P8J59_10620 [Phycisphaerales bacterium]|jgi:hypothetical protein|nr:hypothetical protein [Phycisphaerales bacterium]